jgi:hypothetical protein
MAKFIFVWWIINGTITPAGKVNSDKVYTVWYKKEIVMDCVTKREIIESVNEELENYVEDEETFFKNN